MPLKNCCLGCQGVRCGKRGPCKCTGDRVTGPNCVMSRGCYCPARCKDPVCLHGARRGVVAGSYFSRGYGCIGGCNQGLFCCCCGPECGY